MPWSPVPLTPGDYADRARPWSDQAVINLLPVKAERPGTRSPWMLRDPPGLRPFSVVGTGPIRGEHNAEGTLYVVSGTGLYRISPTGVASSLGTIPGVRRVRMAHNQITGGNQIAIATGDLGYIFDTTTDTLTLITDEGFPGAKSFAFLNQLFLYVEPFGRYWGESALNDGTSYNTIYRYSAEGSPDVIRSVVASQGEALVFGARTIEVWANVVTENASFQRVAVIERGCASEHAIVTLDNSCIFLGDDGIIYRLNQYTPVPISTRALEMQLGGLDLSKAFAFVWEDRGHKTAYFTFPGAGTWGYDIPQGEWHQRESYGLDRWRLSTMAPFARKWIGGDFADGTLWELDWDYHKEGCDELVRVMRSAVMHDNGNRLRVHGVRIEVDTGQERTGELEASITGSLPDGDSGEVVSYQYTINGYVEGDEVSGIAVTSGALPDGLSISTSGLVTGTRGDAGVYSFTISGTDRCGNTVTLTDSSETLPTIAHEILTDAPILYWKLNETSGSTVVDYSGYDRHGTISGTPTQSDSGLTLTAWNQGAFLAGDPGGSPLDVGVDTGWAIEAVVTRTGTGGSAREHIAGQWRSLEFGYVPAELNLMSGVNAGKPQGTFTEDDLSGPVTVAGPSAVTDEVRTHLMVVRDPGSAGLGALRLYKDGVQVAANVLFDSSQIGCVSNGAGFTVGGTNETGYFPDSYGFLGKIEHVAVYDQTITAERVLVHAQALGLA